MSPEPSVPRRRFLGRLVVLLAGAALPWRARRAGSATQALEPYLGEIMRWPSDFIPRGWMRCDGQLLPINQWQALFSLLGTTYGGNGVTTFALPDLRGRVPIHPGQGLGLTHRVRGEVGGEVAHTLTLPEIPVHTHAARGSSEVGTSPTHTGLLPARNAAAAPQWGSTVDTTMPTAVSSVGNGQSHSNLQPYTAVNYIIAVQGAYPSP